MDLMTMLSICFVFNPENPNHDAGGIHPNTHLFLDGCLVFHSTIFSRTLSTS